MGRPPTGTKRGVYDPVRGRQDFQDLGGLTDAQWERLNRMPTDVRRRKTLGRWFGFQGGSYAWRLYCGLDTETFRQTSPAAPSRAPERSDT